MEDKINFSKTEKICFALGFIITSCISLSLFFGIDKENRNNTYKQELLSQYSNYDEIVDDYIPSRKLRIETKEYPSGKMVDMNEKRFFVKKNMEVFVVE